MTKLVQLFVVKSAPRYLILIAAVVLTWLVSWTIFERSDARFDEGNAGSWAYLLATPIWIVFAVLEQRKLIWRLLLIWAPQAFPIGAAIGIAATGDDTGLGALFSVAFIAIMAVPSGIGTIVALTYRPGEAPLRSG